VDKWLTAGGLAKIRGLRRRMDERGVAKRMGVSFVQLKRWALENEEIARALEVDGEMADFLVEETVFNKALSGDQKAIEFWMRRMGEKEVRDGLDYVALADLIRK